MHLARHLVPALAVAGALSLQAQPAQPAGPSSGAAPGTNAPTLSVTNFVASNVVVTNGYLVGISNNVPPTSILGTNISVHPISLADAVQMALTNNYGIQIVRYEPDIARFTLEGSYAAYEPEFFVSPGYNYNSRPGGVQQVGGGLIPLPAQQTQRDFFSAGIDGNLPSGGLYSLSTDAFHIPDSGGPFGDDTEASWGLSLTQPLLRNMWIDNTRRVIYLAKNDLKRSEWELRQQFINTLLNVETEYYNLIAARENIRVARAALDTSNQLLRENKKRVEVGALAPLDEKQAEAEVARAVADLLRTEQDYAVILNRMKALITQDFANWSSVVIDPVENLVAVPSDPDLAESWRRGLTMRPDIQQLKITLEDHKVNLKYFKNQLWPALDLTGTYGQLGRDADYGRALDAMTRDDYNNYGIRATLRIPLGNRSARSNIKVERARNEQDLLRYKALEQTVMIDIDNAIKLLQSRFQEVEATRQARLFSQDALSAEQKKYENGKSTSYTVLQFQRDLTRSRFQEISALANYNIALAALAASEGATLQRFNLSFAQ